MSFHRVLSFVYWPYNHGLFGSKWLIALAMSLLEQIYWIKEFVCLFVSVDFGFKVLLLLNSMHCFAENVLTSLAFSLKSRCKFIFMKKMQRIYKLRFSLAFLLGDASSGQTPTKYRHLACGVEPPLLKNSKDLTVKLKVKYPFPTSFSGANLYFIICLKVWEWEKY